MRMERHPEHTELGTQTNHTKAVWLIMSEVAEAEAQTAQKQIESVPISTQNMAHTRKWQQTNTP